MQIRNRVEGAANRRGIEVFSVLADLGREGSLRLVPHPDQAVVRLHDYLDQLNRYEDAKVIALPYTSIPQALNDELTTLEQLGGNVVRANADGAGWPNARVGKLDQAFLDHLFRGLNTVLPYPDPNAVLPSVHFRHVAEQNPRLIITPGALDRCDDVALHRYEFIKKAADVFDLLLRDGLEGRIDTFFARHGLDHAQSGGIYANFKLHHQGRCVHDETTNTHLKQGDKTTPIAAARIYYQSLVYQEQVYIAVLYAGPHPTSNVTRVHHLDED